MNANDLIARAGKYDAGLAKDLTRFLGSRKFGLVYESSKPEFVRLYKKPIVEGDVVNILPPRGELEDMNSDTDEHERRWKVMSISEGKACLFPIDSEEYAEGIQNDDATAHPMVPVEDLVALARFDQPIYPGLKEVDRIERGGDEPYQVVINGENYHALEALLFAYQGKVDCIYIDPPYNTGAKDWKYNNNYVGQDDRYRHSKWLTFMEDRLKLAKKLLNPQNSVLICTIDEKECLRLGLLLEQIFPEARIQMVTSVINPSGVPTKNYFSRAEEYIFYIFIGASKVCAGESDMLHEIKKDKSVRWASLLRSGNNSSREARPNMFYPLFFSSENGKFIGTGRSLSLDEDTDSIDVPPKTFVVWPKKDNGSDGTWQLQQSTLKEKINKGFVKYGPWKKGDTFRTIGYLAVGTERAIESGQIRIIGRDEDGFVLLEAFDKKVVPLTVWNQPAHSAGDKGSGMLLDIFGEKRFTFPKSLYAEHDTIRFCVADKPNALIIDFFAGSGTTLHAVNLLNAEDGGHRRCICVTNNEVSAEEAKTFTQQHLRQGDPEWEAHGIAHYVTWPRTKCTIQGEDINGAPLSGNYIGSDLPMADGFEANAVFYDLVYLEPSTVSADLAFDEIAPLLWMRAGSQGRIIKHCDTYDLSENYAVLFDYAHVAAFVRKVKENPRIQTVFIVTDMQARYQMMCADLPGRNVVQLYEAYRRSFEIASKG